MTGHVPCSIGRLRVVAAIVLLVATAGPVVAGATAQPERAPGDWTADAATDWTGSETDDAVASATATTGGNPVAAVVPLAVGSDFSIDYRPSLQSQHLGLFVALTALVGGIGYWILLTRQTRGAQLFAATLLVAAVRTGSDVLRVLVGELWTFQTALVAANGLLELFAALLFVRFAGRYVGEERLTDRRTRRALVGVAVVATAVVLTDPIHGYVFADLSRTTTPFVYVGTELGPLGWALWAVTGGLFLGGAGLLASSFTVADRPAWWPASILSMGVSLLVLVAALDVLDGGPLPAYDYDAAGIAGFLLPTSAALLGHGLRRIEITARESILAEMDDAIVVLDDTRTVLDYNDAAERTFRHLEVNRSIDDVLDAALEFPEPGSTTTTELSREVAATPLADAIDELGGDVDRETKHYLVQMTAVATETDDSVGYTVRFADVTDLKERTAALETKNDQLDQFASTVSHDLRNPLNVADGYVDLLEESLEAGEADETVDPSTFRTNVEQVDDALERMGDIIDDILTVARSTDPAADPEANEFRAVVSEAWESVDTRDATLSVTGDGTIEADPDRLQRLLENLFRNAVEHVGPDVAIETGLTDDGFYVADDGPGIPADERDDVFEQGYTTSSEGTGLGLSIVEEIATAHGWSVELAGDGAARFEDGARVGSTYGGARFVVSGCETTIESDRLETVA